MTTFFYHVCKETTTAYMYLDKDRERPLSVTCLVSLPFLFCLAYLKRSQPPLLLSHECHPSLTITAVRRSSRDGSWRGSQRAKTEGFRAEPARRCSCGEVLSLATGVHFPSRSRFIHVPQPGANLSSLAFLCLDEPVSAKSPIPLSVGSLRRHAGRTHFANDIICGGILSAFTMGVCYPSRQLACALLALWIRPSAGKD